MSGPPSLSTSLRLRRARKLRRVVPLSYERRDKKTTFRLRCVNSKNDLCILIIKRAHYLDLLGVKI